MKLFKLAIKMLVKNYKDSYYYILTILVATMAVFSLINTSIILQNEVFSDSKYLSVINTSTEDALGNAIIGQSLSLSIFFIVCVAVLLIGYASYYFVTSKTKEVGVISVSGGSVLHTGGYLSAQNSIIQLVGSIFGLVLGIAMAPIILTNLYNNLGISSGVCISSEAVGVTFAIIVIQFIYTLTAGIGYAYRKTIRELMVDDVTVFNPDKRRFKIPYWVYIIIYVLPLVGVYYSIGDAAVNVMNFVSMSFFGFIGFFTYGLPEILDKLRAKGKLYNKLTMIWVNNLALSIRRSMILIGIMVCMMSVTLINAITNSDNYIISFVGLLTSVCFLLVMSITIIYKILAEAYKRVGIFKQLASIGYTKIENRKIIKREVFVYFFIMMFPTFLPIIIQLIAEAINGYNIPDSKLYAIALIFLINISVAIISYSGYYKIIFKDK